MPVSKYFQPSRQLGEQRLLEDLMVEVIQLFGTDAFYIPRDSHIDPVYGEDPTKTYTSNYPIEIFNVDVNDFQGQKEIFSKFGIELKVEYSILLSRKTFLQRVAQQTPYTRPLEGDLIWIPHVRGQGVLYEITFVNPEADMFMLNRQFPYYYNIKLEPFKYSHEIIQTGVPEVDVISGQDAYTISFTMSSVGALGQYVVGEQVYQGSNLANSTANAYVSYWDNPSFTLNVTNIVGIFATNALIIGQNSGAQYTLTSYDLLADNLIRETFDNEVIRDEGLGYIDESESNPLGNV